MRERLDISVVLPVHARVGPGQLEQCLESLYGQTYLPEEIVVVEDGPLSIGQRAILDGYEGRRPLLRRIRLDINQGAGVANQAGLLAATCPWIAKMDADDICLPDRLETQVDFVLATGVEVCGSAMLEFVDEVECVTGVRGARLLHHEIADWMRMNNPMNHPTTMFRRRAALEAGGYSDMRFMQDYDLFARMLANGSRFGNISKPLVAFRADGGMYSRRSSRVMDRCEWRLQKNLREYGIISTPRMWWNFAARSLFRRLPGPVLKFAYQMLFRRRQKVPVE